METKFIIGNSYSLKEVEFNGFINKCIKPRTMFYKKDNILMTFSTSQPLDKNNIKLISICSD